MFGIERADPDQGVWSGAPGSKHDALIPELPIRQPGRWEPADDFSRDA